MDTIEKSTYRQNKYILWHLGLDIKDSDLTLTDAKDLIGQMKKDPKFVYDYLIQNYNAKILDPLKLKKAIERKEKSMSGAKTKKDLCIELHASNKNLTAKQISEKVGCNLSVVYRALGSNLNVDVKKPKKIIKAATSLKYRQVLNHIKKTPSLYNDESLTLEGLAESYNVIFNTNYSINDFSRCMNVLSKKGYAEKIGKGVYRLHDYRNKLSSDERNFLENYISDCIDSNVFNFSIEDVIRADNTLDSTKVKKAAQNISYSKKIINNHTILSSGHGNYIISREKSHFVSPQQKNVPASDKPYEVAASLYKLVGPKEAHNLINMIEKLTSYLE